MRVGSNKLVELKTKRKEKKLPRTSKYLLFPSQGDLPHPRMKPRSPALQVDSLLSEPPGKPG